MTATDLDTEAWRWITSSLDLASFSNIADALENARDLPGERARDLVEAAIADGTLVEREESGVYTEYGVAEDGESDPEPVDDVPQSADCNENPTDQGSEEHFETTESRVGWEDADFAAPENDTWAPAWTDRVFWMARKGKMPFAPWGDADHPDGEDGKDARYKWSITDNWADKATVDEWVEKDPSLDGHVVLLEKENESYTDDPDPYGFVDGDDVRCPETGEVHPAFVELLDQLGLTYADISTSGSGVHALYEGQLPDDVRQAVFEIDDEPWGANDEVPGVEIYDGKRVCVVTGEHVPGTPLEIHEWDDEALEAILEENIDEEDRQTAAHDTDRERPDLDDYEPSATEATETTEDIRDVFAAIDRLDVYDLPLKTSQVGTDATGWEKWDPSTYRSSSGNDSLHTADRERWYDQKTGHSFGLLALFAAEQGIISKPWHSLTGADFGTAVEKARKNGAPIPEYEPGENGGGQYGIEICEPPIRDADVLDIDERRAELQGSRLDATLENDTVTVWADEAGVGKTTNANIGIAERDERHNDLFHNHRKAREFLTDDVTPDGYDHLKGSDQPRHDCCMDAQVEAGEDETPECPTHGHPSEWEHMLPIYDRPKDDDLRKQFDALLSEVKTRRAIEILELDGGAWEEQFNGLEHTDRLAGVHEYLPLRTATRNRLNIIDEAPKLTATDRTLSVEDLTRMANSLEDVASVSPNDETFQELARFARAIVDLITTPGARLDSTDLAALEPPEIEGETIEVNADDGTADSEVAYVETERVEVDPDDLPDDVDPENVERGHKKEIVDPTGGQYKKVPYHFVERERAVVERELLGEEIATAKVEYGETVLNRMRRDEWNGEPLSIDPLLAAAAAAGLDRDAVMQAVAVSTILEYCPWCHSQLESYNGARVCGSDGCDWHEEHNTLTRKDGERARSMAWIKTDESDAPVALQYRELPLLSELPDPADTLVLDATADPQKIRAWICDEDDPDPVVMGDGPIDMPGLHVTQVADGQYHASTIDQSETARDRIQSAIDTGAQVHEQPLYVVKKGLIPLFDFPENGEVLHYHALRGLNRSDFDAVFCIGAPHPDMDDIRRQAELLAMGRDDIRVGGEEHSTRRNAPNPPVYRKLYYEDEDGKGRAVPTKHYTGMVGRLFRENREREIEQALHRIRPVLADEDEQKHAYLLTNVPTDLPVDDLVSFEELADPLEALVPVPERAIELLEAVRDVSAGNAPDGFRAEALIEQREDGTVANKVAGYHRLAQLNGMDVSQKTVYDWVHALEEIGLLRPETYEQRRGVSYTADFSTLKSALSVLSGNGSFKVAAKRRLKALLAESAGSLGWLEWARDEFGLRGDRCTHRGDDGPPPSPS